MDVQTSVDVKFHALFRVNNPSKTGNGTVTSISSRRERKQKRIMEEEKKGEEKEEEENKVYLSSGMLLLVTWQTGNKMSAGKVACFVGSEDGSRKFH